MTTHIRRVFATDLPGDQDRIYLHENIKSVIQFAANLISNIENIGLSV